MLAEKVLEFIRRNNLLPGGKKVVVAVSGGTDSVCLLHLLAVNSRSTGISLHVAHLNHQLRGAESDADADYVRRLARRLKIPATIERRNVAEYRRKKNIPLEEAAREIRYQFLAEICNREKADCIYTGHTLNDNVETILMNIIRGSGLNGLRGMQPMSKLFINSVKITVTVTRPLLYITRSETEDYCRQRKLKPRHDSSNKEMEFRRNSVRRKLIPLLQEYNPDFNAALLRLSGIAAEQMELLNSEVLELWKDIITETQNAVYIDRVKLKRCHPVLQKHFIRKAIEKLTGTLKDIEINHIEAAAALIPKPSGRSIHLPCDIRISTEYESLVITKAGTSLIPYPVLDEEFTIKVPGATTSGGWRVRASMSGKAPPPSKDPFTACLDADKTGAGLTVRSRRNGDSFMPLGMKLLKKVQDFMVDEKIPRSWRGSVPLLCNSDTIVWLVGWRIDDRYRVTASTCRYLKISFERAA